MYYVYILKSKKHPKQLYKGFTTDLKERLPCHNSGGCPHTAKFKPWTLLFYCAFGNRERALAFEKYLKSASGIAFTRKRLIK